MMDVQTAYQVWVFDHDTCGGQTYLGDTEPGDTEMCGDCGEDVEIQI